MRANDFHKRRSICIKKWPNPAYYQDSSNKYHNGICSANLGEFTFNAQCCHKIKPSSDDCCSGTKDIDFSPCQLVEKDCMDVYPSYEGRMLVLHVNLKNICPNKLIVVGVLIYENDRLYAFKTKKMSTGRCRSSRCRDFDAGEFCFIFEEDHLCEDRKFKAKVISHYVRF